MGGYKFACACMVELKAGLEERVGSKVYFTNTKLFATADSRDALLIKPEPLRIEFSIKGKNGEWLSKTKKSFVMFTFCPFCGKKYGSNEET